MLTRGVGHGEQGWVLLGRLGAAPASQLERWMVALLGSFLATEQTPLLSTGVRRVEEEQICSARARGELTARNRKATAGVTACPPVPAYSGNSEPLPCDSSLTASF